MTKLLIDAGRSNRGWSRIGQFMKCPQLYAYSYKLNLELIPASALTRGSMGHTLQAHLHAIWGAQQGGVIVDTTTHTDPDAFYEPEEALFQWCDVNQGGHEHIDRMLETYHHYLEQHPEPPGRIVAVEHPMSAVLGWKNSKWGLWVTSIEEAEEGFDRARETVVACDGALIQVTPLNMPGHEDHGKPVHLSRRLDMVVEDRSGRICIWDHKHQARVSVGRSVDAYAIDGGFAAFRIMGRQVYGRQFGGLILNLIQTQGPWRVARPTVPPTPHRDSHFAELLWKAEHHLAQIEVQSTDPWRWPKAMHETACFGRYGRCSGLDLCFYGDRALDR